MKKGFLYILKKINHKMNAVFIGVQIVFIILSGLLITLDVLLRWILGSPISGTSEYVGVMMIIASYFGLGICTMERSHLQVDLVVQMLPFRAQKIMDIINSILVIVVASIMLRYGFSQGMVTLTMKTAGAFTHVPYWPFYMMMAISYVPVITGCLYNLIEDIGAVAHGTSTGMDEKEEGSNE